MTELSCYWNQTTNCPFATDRPGAEREPAGLEHLCPPCPLFSPALARAREDGGERGVLARMLLTERWHGEELGQLVAARNREIGFLHDVGLVLQSAVDRDEVIAMALTAITAGKGFGFNRAILLLADEERGVLSGHLAVGPRCVEEAAQIWQEIVDHDYSLKEMAQLFFEKKLASERDKFRSLLDALTIPLSADWHIFVAALNDHSSRHITAPWQTPGFPHEHAEQLGVGELVIVPLISRERRIGLIVADNIISNRPISEEDTRSLETFAQPVSFAIERAALLGRLQDDLVNISEANIALREQQDIIIRMEKLAIVGEMATGIAHSIRNPLTIIGGLARTLLRESPPPDPRRHTLESLLGEARRLEDALHDILSYAEARHPAFGDWDVNPLIDSVVAELRDDLALSGVVARYDFAAELPTIPCDLKKMQHSLRAVIEHALAAMPHGGVLALTTRRNGDEVTIEIAGNGPGMSAEEIAAVFAPFYSRSEDRPGLGLALCARILQQHQARLAIVGDANGTTYTIHLPIAKESPHDTPAAG